MRDTFQMAPDEILEAIKEANLDIPEPRHGANFWLRFLDTCEPVVEGNLIITHGRDGVWFYGVVAKVFQNTPDGHMFVVYKLGTVFVESKTFSKVFFDIAEPVIPRVISVCKEDIFEYMPVSPSVLSLLSEKIRQERWLEEALKAEKEKVRVLVESMHGRIP
jgi:hypothetical protein